MRKRKIEIDLQAFPRELGSLLENSNVYDSSCSSNAAVYYCDAGYYIKVDEKNALAEEASLSRLFSEKGLGVEVINYLSKDRDYLITRSAVGSDLTHYLEDSRKLCQMLADALRDLHSRVIGDVPMSSRYRRYLDSANGAFSGGYYDESVLMDRYRIATKEEAWNIMQEGKHLLKADTLIHGDACLPNVIFHRGKFSSFIDFNMAGVGDKHIDLYWAIWSLQFNLKTEKYTDYFLDAYGREGIQEEKLRVVAAFEVFG